MLLEQDEYWMRRALLLAEQSASVGEVPVGAVLVLDNKIIAEGHNCSIKEVDPTGHAEIVALRKAAHHCQNYRLLNSTLYVTLEPCTMCFGALIHARVSRLVFGAYDPKSGAVQSALNLKQATHFNHSIQCDGGILEPMCSTQLKQFFQAKRKKNSDSRKNDYLR